MDAGTGGGGQWGHLAPQLSSWGAPPPPPPPPNFGGRGQCVTVTMRYFYSVIAIVQCFCNKPDKKIRAPSARNKHIYPHQHTATILAIIMQRKFETRIAPAPRRVHHRVDIPTGFECSISNGVKQPTAKFRISD